MYIRFSVTVIDEDSTYPKGVFQAAIELKKSKSLPAEEEARIRGLLQWFNDNLPAPEDFDRVHALFWFKAEAQECISRVWEIVGFLREHGFHVDFVTCKRPGKIVYNDDYQVAAIPFADTRQRL